MPDHSRWNKNNEILSREAFLDNCIVNIAKKSENDFSLLYHHTSAAVYSYALSILKNIYDAEDVMHDCFLKIYGAAPFYRPEGKPLRWILTITRNLCYEKLKEKSRFVGPTEENGLEKLFSREDVTAEQRLLAESCMKLLTAEERQIVVLHAVAGLKHREIAAQMELALPTVLSKYNRALKKLRAQCQKEESDESPYGK